MARDSITKFSGSNKVYYAFYIVKKNIVEPIYNSL